MLPKPMLSLLQGAEDAVKRLIVRSALNPLLWLTALVVVVFLPLAIPYSQSDVLRPYCAWLIITPICVVGVTLFVGVMFAAFSPDKLQSEDFQIRQKAMVMLQRAGAMPKEIDLTSIAAIANPAATQHSLPKEVD